VSNLRISEEKVAEFFMSYGFRVELFKKDEMRVIGKTPDFKIYKDSTLVFYCEVKEINEDNRKYEDDIEKDNTYNIISDCINESYKQFTSTNSEHNVPNILAIYSRRMVIDILDFKITFEGGFHTEEGKFLPWVKDVSEGRIKNKKMFIDMCLWYDEDTDGYSISLNKTSIYYKTLEECFSILKA
jgi:hypothetical protein